MSTTTHQEKYQAFAKAHHLAITKAELFGLKGLDDLKAKLAADPHLNNIPLGRFDMMTHSYNAYNPQNRMTLADGCCAYKELLRQLAEAPARVYTFENDWPEFIAALDNGEDLEVDAEIFDYFLGVLPPIFMGKVVDGKRYAFGFAEGAETVRGFWQEGDRYFCRDTGRMNPYA